MKKFIFIFSLFVFGQFSKATSQGLQPGECGVMFTYDATGSLLQRQFICNNTGSVMNRTANAATNINGKNDSLAFTLVSQQENNMVKVSALMPNPTTGKFTIALASALNKGQVILTDANGKIVEKKTVSGYMFTFDISSQPSGVYFVRTENKGKVFTFKVIKQ